MKPYYHDEKYNITIYNGDCRDILPELPKSDLIFTDPPFNTGGKKGWYSKSYGAGEVFDNMTDEDFRVFCDDWFHKARKVTKRILVTPGILPLWNYPAALWMIIISRPAAPSFSKLGSFNVYEPLLVYDKPLKRITRDVVTFHALNMKRGVETDHPCPDNPKMVGWIYDNWSLPGEMIYDPFMGSGTGALVAKELGRKFVGIEIEEKFCEMTISRLRQEIINFEE